MVGSEHAAASISDAAASATRELDASASKSHMPRHPRVVRTRACIVSTRTLKNHQIKTTIDFKVIPFGEVPYMSLVSAKNIKLTSMNQNLDN